MHSTTAPDATAARSAAKSPRPQRVGWTTAKRWTREPLLHFFLLSGLFWSVHAYWQSSPPRPRIAISTSHIAQLAQHYQQQYGVRPTGTQLEALIDTAIAEEVTYQEAIRLGLARDDEIVRRRLIQKYEFLQEGITNPERPTREEAQYFYQRHPERYVEPERLSFTQVYFSPDRRGDDDARDAAAQLAARLNNTDAVAGTGAVAGSGTGMPRPAAEGDLFPGPTDFIDVTLEDIARVFGREGLAQGISAVPLEHWSAPLQSGFGWHIVYVSRRVSGRPADFDAVRDQVTADWLATEQLRHKAEQIAQLRSRYEIVRE